MQLCQCPKRADFISTTMLSYMDMRIYVCQCPKRADFISTRISLTNSYIETVSMP